MKRFLTTTWRVGLLAAVCLAALSTKFGHGARAANQTSVGAPPVGDFNGDGNPDIAAVKTAAGTVVFRAGKGNGTFYPPGALFPAGEIAVGLSPA